MTAYNVWLISLRGAMSNSMRNVSTTLIHPRWQFKLGPRYARSGQPI